MKLPIRTLAALGCRTLLLTNAAGSLRPEMPPGSIMAIADHINFVGVSPLFGEAGDGRFLDMTGAYDEGLRARLRDVARRERIDLPEGIYAWFCGPNFETPAEIRAARVLGADAVGMSTVPEVILARHAGLTVAALSIITNMAAGLGAAPLSHEQTLRAARQASENATKLIRGFLTGFDG
jgi:purine-nucleoside phosphorylase